MTGLPDTNVTALISLNTHLSGIKREERRLAVRLIAVERYARIAKSATAGSDEEDEDHAEVVANIEAVQYDLSTYLTQLRDRINHIESGLVAISESSNRNHAFVQYITEDARLCARDVSAAREGYDDLIENIDTLTHLRDNDQ